jgi:dTDP-4-amino-4,6-dideoxygalactose transaminase
MKKNISIYRPAIKRKDLENVLDSMMQDRIDYGDYARNFEERLSNRIKCHNILVINSYFNAIWLIFEALEIGEGDEVILPSFAPQIYLNIILLKKAKPVLIDLDKNALIPSLEAMQNSITNKTKAVILYHYFGYYYNFKEFHEIFPDIIEDVSSILGGNKVFDNVKLNSSYAVSDFSVKGLITTGEGAAIFCKERKQYKKIFSLLEIGYDQEYYPRISCLMPDLNAAMGISQDKSLNHRLELRKQIGKIYEEAVKKSRGSHLIQEEDKTRIYSDFPMMVKSSLKDAIKYFKRKNVEVIRPFAYPLHHYLNLDKKLFANTEYYYLNSLLLPIYSILNKKDVDLINKIIMSLI